MTAWQDLSIAELWRTPADRRSSPELRERARARRITIWLAVRTLAMPATDVAAIAGISVSRVRQLLASTDARIAYTLYRQRRQIPWLSIYY